MNKEWVLDIGIGSGGEYIKQNTAPHERRVGIDIFQPVISNLKANYPDVLPVVADAENLPFKTNAFSRIEIVLPFDDLLIPGLQDYYFDRNDERGQRYVIKENADGKYFEFQRVLKPEGELLIYGDLWVEPDQVRNTSAKYFEVEQVRQLTLDEYSALKTFTTEGFLSKGLLPTSGIQGKKWEDLLVKINLRSKKVQE